MPFIGNKPTAVPLSSADLEDDIITSAKITDGTIALADLSATGTKDATTFLRGDNTFAEAGGGGGLIFIKKITASNDASISFQDGSGGVVIDSTYDNYIIKFSNVRAVNSNVNLNTRMYIGGTEQTSNYGTTTAIFNGSQGGVSTGTAFQEITDGCATWENISNQTEKGLNGELCFSTPTDTSQFPTVTYSGGIVYDGLYGRVKSYVGTGGYKTSGTALTGFKFFFNSGNIAEGIFTLYGMVKA
jgi:hypothetical protein